jgi:signal transduction histidine kinase
LVADIEHNVIIPNMFYKLFFRRLHGKIQKNREIESRLETVIASHECANDSGLEELRRLHRELASVNEGLSEEYANIQKHYQNTSLFLETLLRPDHFEKGRYIVRKRKCNFKKQIIDPQLERYEARFKGRNISIDERVGGVPDEEMNLAVDIGLISQVYANLFSNALKYTDEVLDGNGHKMKYVSHGREVLRDYFAPGIDGIKFNVFTTGPHLSGKEIGKLYEEGFRGSNAEKEPGTGHGLHFIKNVVEIHGGTVGYEPTPLGNNFYFILPK